MGRPKEFDRDVVLDRAVDIFRANGYKGTSMQMLLDGMGIHRSSLYEEFGDKHNLFLAAFLRYERKRRDQLEAILCPPGPRLPRIRRYFEDMVEEVLTPPVTGCLLLNSAVELGSQDPKVADLLQQNFTLMENLLYVALDEAVRGGEMAARTDLRAVARYLLSSVRGVRLTARVVQQRDVLVQIVDVTLSLLGKTA